MASDKNTLTVLETERVSSNGADRSAAQVRAELARTEQRLQDNLSGLRQELTLRDVTLWGMPITDLIRQRPIVVVAATAGLMAGVMVITRVARRRSRRETAEADTVRQLVTELVDRAAARTGLYGDAEATLRRALHHNAPVIVVENPHCGAPEESRGVILSALSAAVKMGAGYGLKFAMNEVSRGLEARRAAEHPAPPPTEPYRNAL